MGARARGGWVGVSGEGGVRQVRHHARTHTHTHTDLAREAHLHLLGANMSTLIGCTNTTGDALNKVCVVDSEKITRAIAQGCGNASHHPLSRLVLSRLVHKDHAVEIAMVPRVGTAAAGRPDQQ